MMAQENTSAALVETDSCPMGVTLVNTRQTNRLADSMDLVDLARQVQTADEFVRANVGNKLTVIVDQIRYLQEQARKILQKANTDADLHHAACNMIKRPGQSYYLYRRPSGQKYFSMLSPEEWGASCPHEFIGAYRLENDMSWTSLHDVAQRDADMAAIKAIVGARTVLSDASNLQPHLLGLLPATSVNDEPE